MKEEKPKTLIKAKSIYKKKLLFAERKRLARKSREEYENKTSKRYFPTQVKE